MKRYISDIILYLCLGCFSYFVLVNYADIPIRSREQLITFKAFSTVAFIFCGIGLSIRLVYGKMMSFYQYFLKDKRALSIAMIICAIILLAVSMANRDNNSGTVYAEQVLCRPCKTIPARGRT